MSAPVIRSVTRQRQAISGRSDGMTSRRCLSPLAVFEELEDILRAKSVYEFLRQEVVHGYHDHAAFLRQAEDEYTAWVDDEIRESMGIAAEQSYLGLFNRYINHVSHWVKR